MSWRDLPPVPEDRADLGGPHRVVESDEGAGGQVTIYFTDRLSRQWWAEFLKTKRAAGAFGDWVDERR